MIVGLMEWKITEFMLSVSYDCEFCDRRCGFGWAAAVCDSDRAAAGYSLAMAETTPTWFAGCTAGDGIHSDLGVLHRTESFGRATRNDSDRAMAARVQRTAHRGFGRHSCGRQFHRRAKAAHDRRAHECIASGNDRDTRRLHFR